MSLVDQSIEISVALGEGVRSVAMDVLLGFQRTSQGLSLGGRERVSVIGYENKAMAKLLGEIVKNGVKTSRSPLLRSITLVLEHYYSHFPEEAVEYLARKANIGAAYGAGRLVIGKKLAEFVATRIAVAIATSSAYKAFAARIGASASASATGIGAPIGIAMAQGVMQRASHASIRLRAQSPTTYRTLKDNGDLQLLYFILENPLKEYVCGIAHAERNALEFHNSVRKKYGLKGDQ